MFKDLSIRIKIIVGQVVLIAMVAIFIYSYYPRQQEKAELASIESKIYGISNMFSLGVGIGMGETDYVAVGEALDWAHADSSVVYISVVNTNNEEIAAFSALPHKPTDLSTIKAGDKPKVIGEIVFFKTPTLYQGLPFGTMVIGYSLHATHQRISALKLTTLYFCLALFAGGVLLAFIISEMITGNIRKLDSTVKAISSGAENIHVEVASNDEIGKLARAFNQMIHRLEKSRMELIKNSEQLKKQNDELNQFSYVVSHDLKAPLRAIFKLSEWIQEDLGPSIPEEVKKNIQILRGRVFRLEALINGLLQYSKIGRMNFPVERLDVNQLLKETVELLNPPPHIKVHIQNGMPVFNTKKILLQQVFSNLISNAIKYNDKPEGIVEITVKDAGEYYEFAVKDNGIGIEEAYHKKIFEIFQTLNARDKIEGTGVGLSITKKSVEDMGGEIELESEKDKGSKFIFTWLKAA
jgi:signal transduction histidine kinase